MIGALVKGSAAPGYANLIYLPGCYLSGMFFPLTESMYWQAPLWPQFHVNQLAMQAAGITKFQLRPAADGHRRAAGLHRAVQRGGDVAARAQGLTFLIAAKGDSLCILPARTGRVSQYPARPVPFCCKSGMSPFLRIVGPSTRGIDDSKTGAISCRRRDSRECFRVCRRRAGAGRLGRRHRRRGQHLHAEIAPTHHIQFSAIGLDHAHIYGMTRAVLRGGGELVSFYSEDAAQIAALPQGIRRREARRQRGRDPQRQVHRSWCSARRFPTCARRSASA